MIKRINFILFVLYLIIPAVVFSAGVEDLKKMALSEFGGGNYAEAIRYLKEAEEKTTDDPEIYYYLGYFTHYLCYDSVPLSGYGPDESEEVLDYLKRAVELEPGYGNAYYFMGVECGARARIRLTEGDVEGAGEEFRRGMELGGYPGWLIEYGRNTLKSCKKNAILFLGGDADTNPVQYLQIVEGYRTDVTLLPMALMSRPWFIKLIKEDVEGVFPAAPVSWSDYQISNMHNYKWQANTVEAPLSEGIKEELDVEGETFSWQLKPDLSERLISAGRAATADVINTNGFERPVYFSLACGMVEGLKENLQLSGLALRLLPVKTTGTDLSVDAGSTEDVLLNRENYSSLPGVAEKDMPRISGMLANYPAALLRLCGYLVIRGRNTEARAVFTLLEQTGMENYIQMESLKPHFQGLREKIE